MGKSKQEYYNLLDRLKDSLTKEIKDSDLLDRTKELLTNLINDERVDFEYFGKEEK